MCCHNGKQKYLLNVMNLKRSGKARCSTANRSIAIPHSALLALLIKPVLRHPCELPEKSVHLNAFGLIPPSVHWIK